MHRQVLKPKNNEKIDHINGNGLDNRKQNLRIATRSQNSQNSKKRKNCTSRYKGVLWSNSHKKWKVSITLHRKTEHLGYFVSELDAAKAYDEMAQKYFGCYARLNFPLKGGPDRVRSSLFESQNEKAKQNV